MKTSRLVILSVLISFTLMHQLMHQRTPVPKTIQPKTPTEQSIREGLKNEQRQQERIRQYKNAAVAAGKVYKRQGCQSNLAEPTGRIAVEQGVSARLLAAVVFVESSCNPNAVSNRGDIGLTQIHYKIWKQHTKAEYFNPSINLETGAMILASNIRKYGLKEGLHAYNGLNGTNDKYAEKVLMIAGIN